MFDPRFELLSAAAGMSAFAAAGGWAIASKVAGRAAVTECFLLLAIALPVLALQILLCHASAKRLLYTIAYHTRAHAPSPCPFAACCSPHTGFDYRLWVREGSDTKRVS